MPQRHILTKKELEKLAKAVIPFASGFELINDHVIITDEDANILYANAAAEYSTGYSKSEMIGKNPGDLWGGKMPKNFYEKMWKTIKFDKKPFIGSVLNVRKNGQEYWQELRVSPIFDKKGNVKFFIGIEPEISIPERIKTALIRESEQHLAKAQYISRTGSIEIDLVKNKMYWSSELYDILGITAKEVKASRENFLKFVYPGDRKYLQELYDEILGDFESREIIFRAIKKTGEELVLHARFSVIVNGSNKPLKIIEVIQDVTEKKHEEEKEFEMRRNLQLSVISALTDSKNTTEIFENIFNAILGSLDYQLIQLWIFDEENKVLRCVKSQIKPDSDLKNFVKISKEITFKSGIGLPGRVYRSKEPAWISDISRDPNFPRFKFAAEADLHGAFGFFIPAGDKKYVIEVFSTRITAPDQNLLNLLKTLGHQIGEFILRKQTEEKMSQNETWLREAERMAHFGRLIWRVKENKAEWSEELYRIFGINPENPALNFEEFLEFVAPEEKEKVKAVAKNAIEKRIPQEFDHSIIKKNGERRLLHNWITVSEAADGEIKIIGVIQDITDQKLIQNLAEAKARNEAVLLSMTDGFVSIGLDEKVIFMNRAAENMLGFSTDEIIGKRFVDFVQMKNKEGNLIFPDERPLILALKEGISIATSATEDLAYYFVRKDGTQFPIAISVTPIIFEDRIIGAMNVFRDITKEIEVNRIRSEFISFASHQLRTPLTAMSWIAEVLLKKEQISEKGQIYLNDMRLSIKRLSELVELFLTVSRIESRKLAITIENFDIVAVINKFIEEYEPLAIAKKVQIIFKEKPGELTIASDQNLMRNIIQSLISNASDYTPKGGEVEVALKKIDSKLIFSVKDSGIGISKENQLRIFERFFRAENARLVKPSGSGLGLYMVRETLNLLGGKVWFESEEGKGTTFFVELPIDAKKIGKKT